MPLPLPTLDTRRWTDLVEEGRAVIPRYAPGWTDHNIHDPGITLLELFAWLTEQLIYRANRVPKRHLRKFLALAGFPPEPPLPARAVIGVQPAAGTGQLTIPAATPFVVTATDGRSIWFRTATTVTVVETHLVAMQRWDGARFVDASRAYRDGVAIPLLGADPRTPVPYDVDRAPACYFGFDRAIPVSTRVTLWLQLVGTGHDERERIDREAEETASGCERPPRRCKGSGPEDDPGAPPSSNSTASRDHHSARIVWEILTATGWQPLDSSSGEVDDQTRALTLDGPVHFRPPAPMAQQRVGDVAAPLYWIRCRLVRGAFDAAPTLLDATLNAVLVEQARQGWQRLSIAAGVTPVGTITPGQLQRLTMRVDDRGFVQALAVEPATSSAPQLLVLEYVAPTAMTRGSIALPLVVGAIGTGLPEQHFTLEAAPVANGEVTLHSLEDTGGSIAWRAWTVRRDLDASSDTDTHASLDAVSGDVRFGDGVRGRVPPNGASIVASYRTTLGASGNISGNHPWQLADDLVARAMLGASFGPVSQATVASRVGARFGAAAEDVGAAAARAAAFLWAHERLVDLCPFDACDTLDQLDRAVVLSRPAPPRATTTLDVERIAVDVPGTRVRRARAWAGLDAVDPCLDASGTITLVIVPELPRGRPSPSAGLIRSVRRWLDRRRVLCTRLVVVGPTYLDVSVTATVRALPSADAERVQRDVVAALTAFLDPLTGGPAGHGWPFGRDVYRSEILQTIDAVPGVDHVITLALSAQAGDTLRAAACDNLCVPTTWLVASAAHAVQVLRA